MALVGRALELQRIDAAIASVATGGQSLLVRGDSGIGKSALLREGSERARRAGMRLLEVTGVPSEMSLPFAGLHQLLRPILGSSDGLPRSQQSALRAAFGIVDEVPPDPFLIGLATLTLIAEAANSGPVVIVVDDAQWLDVATVDALAFVIRRIAHDPILFLIAIRDGIETPLDRLGLPVMHVGELDVDSAAALLNATAPRLKGAAAARVLSEAAGNPLALEELPIGLPASAADRGDLPPALPLTSRLEQAFAARAVGLPPATTALLLVTAASDTGDIGEILASASLLAQTEVGVSELEPAMARRLVAVTNGRVRFSHPLIRAAVMQIASEGDRRDAHAAIAGVVADPDRRAWHEAASIVGTNAAIAADLAAAAERARRRGAISVALAALIRAAALSGADAQRGRHLIAAAELAFQIGRRSEAMGLLEDARRLEVAASDQARAAWLREWYAQTSWTGGGWVGPAIEVADQLRQAGDGATALQTLVDVSARAFTALVDPPIGDRLIAAAERVAPSPDSPALLFITINAAPKQRAAAVAAKLVARSPTTTLDPEDQYFLGYVSAAVDAFDRVESFMEPALVGLRAQGRLALVAQGQVIRAYAAWFTGAWLAGRVAAAEAIQINREMERSTNLAVALAMSARIEAVVGHGAIAREQIAEAERLIVPLGAHRLLAFVQTARGAAALAEGRHEEAYQDLRRLWDEADLVGHPSHQRGSAVDLVDAAVHVGRADEIRDIVDSFEVEFRDSGSPLLQASLVIIRALMAADDDAEQRFNEANREKLATWPFFRGRLLLAQGVWLRRHRRSADARVPIRAAREVFDALGAVLWAERARTELRASGEQSSNRDPHVVDRLTPQEAQIARLAAAGLSNRVIADQLFLSPRTVGFHLYRLFPKLGITSRSQLHVALSTGPEVLADQP